MLSDEFPESERFEIAARLGSGSTGIVYAAFDRVAGERVALKLLRHQAPDAVADFKREFRSIADLEHPNLVRFGELLCAGGRWLFTMELVEGQDFLAFVRPSGGLDRKRLDASLVQLVSVLDFLHQQGRLHRDVKPQNVLILPNGSLKLVDFGLICGTSSLTDSREDLAVGTTAYVSPEQAAGERLSPASDLYSVGVMLYEALADRLPFEGPPLKVLMEKQTAQPVPPNSGDPRLDQLCLSLLAAQPERRPSGSQMLLLLQGPRASATRSAPPTRSRAFFGREHELQALLQAVTSVRGGRPLVRWVTGSSGVGKTALLMRVARRLASEAALVLQSRCRPQESVPYRALDGIIDDLARHLASLSGAAVHALVPAHGALLSRTFPAFLRVPSLAQGGPEEQLVKNPLEQRKRAFAALRLLLRELGRHRTLVFVIDDLHWADADSLSLLRSLLTGANPPAVALLTSVRAEGTRSPGASALTLSELRAQLPVPGEPLALGGLAPESAIALASHLIELDRPEDPPHPAAIAQEAEGHPRLIEELVQYTKEATASDRRPSLESAVRMRTSQLPAQATRLVELLALADVPVPTAVLARAAGMSRAELGRELTALQLTRLVRRSGPRDNGRVELVHDRIRDIVLAGIAPDAQRRHHHALALAYEQEGASDLEALSRHWQGADNPQRAAAAARGAADEALRTLAFARAAQLYREAIRLSGPAVSQSLYAHLGDALVSAGHGADGSRAYLLAAGKDKSLTAVDLRRRAAEQLLVSGRAEEGLGLAKQIAVELKLAISESRALSHARSFGRWLSLELWGYAFKERDASEIPALDLLRIDAGWSLFVGFASVDPARALEPLTLHVRLSLKAGEPYRVARGLAALAIMLTFGQDQTRHAQELADRAEAIGERIKQPHVLGLCHMHAGLRAFHSGDQEAAKVSLEQAERCFHDGVRGTAWELSLTQFLALLCHLTAGDIATTARLSGDWHDEAIARGDLLAATNLRVRILPAVAMLQGDGAHARALAGAPVEVGPHDYMGVQRYWREVSLTECDLYEARGREALSRVQAFWPAFEAANLLRMHMVRVDAHWLRARAQLAALDAGDPRASVREVLRAAAAIEDAGLGGCRGLGLSLRAAVHELRADTGRALQAWQGAEAQLRADGRELMSRLAQLRRGRIDDSETGRRAKEDALAWLAGAGAADPWRAVRLFMPGGLGGLLQS